MIELSKNTIGIGVFGMKLKTKLPVLVPAIILAVLICAGTALYIILIFNEPAPSKQIVSATDKSELTIDIKTIEHEIKDIGNLCTSEYNFTAVDSFSKDKINLWFIKLPWTDSSAIVKYSGTITAGIDFTKVIVEENIKEKTVQITLPPAQILNSELDFKSFELLDEKNGLFNRITVEDTNQALDKLIDEETDKAVADGLLDKAQTNAKDMIANLFKGVCSASGYKLLPVKFE